MEGSQAASAFLSSIASFIFVFQAKLQTLSVLFDIPPPSMMRDYCVVE